MTSVGSHRDACHAGGRSEKTAELLLGDLLFAQLFQRLAVYA
jgi:hypothetical protein